MGYSVLEVLRHEQDLFSRPLKKRRTAPAFLDGWKMPKMEKFNSFSRLPKHKLICLQRHGLKWLSCARPCIFSHSKKSGERWLWKGSDSYLVLDSLSLQSSRLLSSRGGIDAKGLKAVEAKCQTFRDAGNASFLCNVARCRRFSGRTSCTASSTVSLKKKKNSSLWPQTTFIFCFIQNKSAPDE